MVRSLLDRFQNDNAVSFGNMWNRNLNFEAEKSLKFDAHFFCHGRAIFSESSNLFFALLILILGASRCNCAP